jgi:membrane protease YdiL (CAAX protease family)
MEAGNIDEINIAGQIVLLVIAFLFGSLAIYVATQRNYFKLPSQISLERRLSFLQVLGAFVSFLIFQILIIPILMIMYVIHMQGHLPENGISFLDPSIEGWFNVAAMGVSCLAVAVYYRGQNKKSRNLIWNREQEKSFKDDLKSLFYGFSSWIIAYPVVFFVGQGLSLLFYILLGLTEQEQVAVRSLKITGGYPVLNVSMILSMAVLVPIMEEVLFRGFLQTWLRGKVSVFKAIMITSLIFALFHYSYTQGISNIEYIAALFLLSSFLGFLYEREKSLWAPIGLHVAFNTISIAIISLTQS